MNNTKLTYRLSKQGNASAGKWHMNNDLEVSFNSPQCGWMSIGFEYPGGEFHTTTAYSPHKTALADVLKTITGLVSTAEPFERTLKWNRDPEEYDFIFSSNGDTARIKIIEYPTVERLTGENVFEYEGEALQIAKAFNSTFQQLYDEKDIDEFEENWHQKFPFAEFEELKRAVSSA